MRNRRWPAAWLTFIALGAPFSSLVFARSDPAPVPPTDVGALSPDIGSAQRQAAEAGLAMLIKRWTAPGGAGDAQRIFEVAGDRLRTATIGDGFETYLVDPKRLLSGDRLADSLYGSGEWRFIVMAEGKSVGLLTVARMNGTWTMVEAGARELAQEITAVALRDERRSPGARLRFIRSQQAVADFIEISGPNSADAASQPIFVPLASARAALPSSRFDSATSGSPFFSESQLGDALRQSVRRGMRDPRVGR